MLIGSLAGGGAAVLGLSNFADHDDGCYLARLWARAPGNYDDRVANASGSIDYCADSALVLYAPLELPASGCTLPASTVDLTPPGCYEFAVQTDGSLLPADVELTVGERLGHFDITLDAAGGVY